MFVRPSLVGGSLRRSNWKLIRESPYFVLQQRNANNNTSTQQNNNNKRRQHYGEYRIITKGFPHYRVSDHDDLSQIQDAFDILHQEVLVGVEGKKTSKKILKQLKSWCENNENSLPFDEDADGYATDTSATPGNSSNEMEDHDNDNDPLISPEVAISSNSSTKSENAVITSAPIVNNSNKGNSRKNFHSPEQLEFTLNNSDDSEDIQSSDVSDNEGVTGGTQSGPVNEWTFLGSSVLDSLMGWLGGPSLESVPTASSSSKQANTNASNNNKNETILDIPMQFIGLLTYPEIDPKASKKASFAVLREISFVKQRRKVLFLLTIYMFLIRFCSFDLFLVLLFASNCAMLFLMKNSGKVNVTMAKRAVRQRIGWAKQWAGSLFKNKTNNNVVQPVQNNSGSNNTNNHRKNSNNSNNGTTSISSNVYVNGSTNSVNGVGVSGQIQPANMTKSTSQDILQSGSLSDTTHGGSVLTKITAPKRGVFFRKSGTTSQTNIKEDKIISSTETSSSTGPPSLQRAPSDFPFNSLSSTNGINSSIQSSNSQISLSASGGNVNELSQLASNTSITQQSTQSPTTRRRFFPKRGGGNNHNNHNSNNSNSYASNNSNFTLPNIVPTSPLQNTTLLDTDSNKTSQIPVITNGSSTVTNGNEGSNEDFVAHFIKLSNSQQSSSSATDSDVLVNDIYYEGERLKSFPGDLKVK